MTRTHQHIPHHGESDHHPDRDHGSRHEHSDGGQAQILDLLSGLRRETGMAMVFISHDLGAVSAVCDRAAVMYAGRIVEEGDIATLFSAPAHPYTRGLFAAIPEIDAGRAACDHSSRTHAVGSTIPAVR